MMDEAPIIIKTEKIDPEIEEKIQKQFNIIKIKKELESSEDSSSSSGSNAEQEDDNRNEDKKNIELQKSSNELLAELFQVFNVAVKPDELFNDEDLLKKAKKSKKSKEEKRKKHKKHKKESEHSHELAEDLFKKSKSAKKSKKEKRKKQKSHEKEIKSDESDSDKLHDKKEKHKHKKKKKHKSRDEENSTECSSKEQNSNIKTDSSSKSKERDKEKSDKQDRGKNSTQDSKLDANGTTKTEKYNDDKQIYAVKRKRHATADKTNEPPAKIKFCIERRSDSSRLYNGHSSGRTEKSKDKDSLKEKSKDSQVKSEDLRKSNERSSDSRRHQRHSRDRFDKGDLSDLSLSDEETYLRERARSTEERRRDYNYHKSRNRRDLERFRRRSPDHSRRRSRSRDLGIDKKRLLEIARKNAISMFKRGSLPGCANMTEDVKDKVLLQMRYGGRTVQDLTDFCRKISNGEPLPELSSDNDSEIDKNGNVKPFHHPYQVKERDPIVLQLRNPIPIPTTARKEEQTKAITMQFPVSSGQEHRRSESWVPIEAKPAPLPTLPAAALSTNIFKQTVPKNVFEKPLPAAKQQEPAFKPINASSAEADSTSTNAKNESQLNKTLMILSGTTPNISNDAAEVTSTFVPDVPIPSSTTNESVFPEMAAVNLDVSSIVSKRLTALRRLQENPMDSEAIKIMYNSQKEMSTWASSKYLPGQFTGSTGANVLSAHELNSGPQVWARRDQLTSTKPVTEGMGMHLLQKMGWRPGEGLGPNKKGALQPLLLDIKLDKRGLVAKDDTGANGIRPQNKKRPNTAQEVVESIQNKHPVCILNELTSKRKLTPPVYNLVTERGPSHNKKFLFSVTFNGQLYQPPDGSNTKKEAKMIAAKFCLAQIGVLPS